MAERLPEFVAPMLAQLGRVAFDSDEHLFEVKWDGTRALSFTEPGEHRLRDRRGAEMRERFPELAFLAALEPGLVLDGEIVVLAGDRPDFGATMGRVHARGARRIAALARSQPATYFVFDLLYRGYAPRLERPLRERRAELAELVERSAEARLVLSQGVIGGGRRFFAELERLELEGMVAKDLASPYRPGQRSEAWTKVKRSQECLCAVIGYVPDESGDFKSLVIAAEMDGELRCVGRVGGGISRVLHERIRQLLLARPASSPLVDPRGVDGVWVEPGLYCRVSYLERTKDGNLRAPVFLELVDDRGDGP